MPKNNLGADSKQFLKFWREQYKWPSGFSRKASEDKIFELLNETSNAISSGDSERIERSLVGIHRWKTNNRSGISEKYEKVLANDTGVVPFLQSNFLSRSPKFSPEFFKELLDTLKIRYCNLPICSAQASFLLNRKLPILDRFVAQFFSLTMSESILYYDQFDMNDVLRDIDPVKFRIEDDGSGRCVPRLAVYQQWSYEINRSLFISQYIPQLIRIAKVLNKEEVEYKDIHDVAQDFFCVDVEMAVFAFAMKNRHYFQYFYEKNPTRVDL